MRTRQPVSWIVVLVLAINTCGCAAIFNGTSDMIHVRTDADDAEIYIDGQMVGKNSGMMSVPKKGDHFIRVSKEGCKDGHVEVPYSFDPVTLLGILIDAGLISILVVDGLATGATSKASQTHFVVNPYCEGQGPVGP